MQTSPSFFFEKSRNINTKYGKDWGVLKLESPWYTLDIPKKMLHEDFFFWGGWSWFTEATQRIPMEKCTSFYSSGALAIFSAKEITHHNNTGFLKVKQTNLDEEKTTSIQLYSTQAWGFLQPNPKCPPVFCEKKMSGSSLTLGGGGRWGGGEWLLRIYSLHLPRPRLCGSKSWRGGAAWKDDKNDRLLQPQRINVW